MAENIHLIWLGQAGFLIKWKRIRVLIDPYLSDYLAQKYRGTEFPHVRMMAPPLKAEALRKISLVMCTHAHSDHMDPVSLPIIAANNPECLFVIPRAEKKTALGRGIPAERICALNAGERLDWRSDVTVQAVASAHEQLVTDPGGNHRFLGYVVKIGATTFYHSGDCIPYPGLEEVLHPLSIDVALLPVNGRDANRTKKGIAGNFTFDEAVALCHRSGIPSLVVHHYGMFAFNTLIEKEIESRINAGIPKLHCLMPRAGTEYTMNWPMLRAE